MGKNSSGNDDQNTQNKKDCDEVRESTETDAPSTPPAGAHVGNYEPTILRSQESTTQEWDDSKNAKASGEGNLSTNEDKIYVPRTYDVLFGRGRPLQKHPGNLRFHKIVNRARETYLNARKEEKIGIARKVMDEIKTSKKKSDAGSSSDQPIAADADDGGGGVDSPSSGGEPARFLKKVGDANASGMDMYWEEVTEEVAIEKVSHALRGRPRSETRSRKDLNSGGAGGTKSSSCVSDTSGSSIAANAGKSKRKGPPSPPTNETTPTPVVLEDGISGDSEPSAESLLPTLAQEIQQSGSGTSDLTTTTSPISTQNQSQTTVGLPALENQQQQALLMASQLQQLQTIQPSRQQLLQQLINQQQQQQQQLLAPSSAGTGSATGEATQSPEQILLQQLLNQQQQQLNPLFGPQGIIAGTAPSKATQPRQQQLPQQLIDLRGIGVGPGTGMMGQGQQQLLNTGVTDTLAAQQFQMQLLMQQQQIQQLLSQQQQQMQAQLLQDPQMQILQQLLPQHPRPGHSRTQQQQLPPLPLQQHSIDANVVRAAAAIQSAIQHARSGTGITGPAAIENHNNVTEALILGASAMLVAHQNTSQNQANQHGPQPTAATSQQPSAPVGTTISASGAQPQHQQQSQELLLALLSQQQALSMLLSPQEQNPSSSSQRNPPPGGPAPSGS